jgi:hypothetical protein
VAARRAKSATVSDLPADSPRQRAARALAANPSASLTAIAAIAGVSRGTVIAARDDFAAEARKPREAIPSTPIGGPKTAKPSERRQRAQRFLKDALAHGPKQVSDVEAAAAKVHIDEQLLGQARTDLGIVTTRANTGGAQAVQWSLPG